MAYQNEASELPQWKVQLPYFHHRPQEANTANTIPRYQYDYRMMARISSNSHTEFPSEQAQLLQDIARDGNADDYGYSDNAQTNGFDELDPATLLESLANFEHPASSSEPPIVSEPPVTSERHFESLLQAVASADGQEAAQASRGQNQSKTPAKPFTTTDQFSFPRGNSTTTRTKRKRRQVEDEESADDNFGFLVTNKTKRRKYRQAETPEQLALENEIWGPDDFEETEGDGLQELEGRTPIAGADARAAGVHSAAALFRRPSAASKKYTRPPMSTLFTSLELHPEHFLHLQAAAKNYMLDDRYPERSDCVGNRGRGDTDMTKLKLFGCVKSFLEDEGWGERCFGAKAPGAETRKLKWPQMKNKVISLITPLLRRMVTNERQRLYALQARKNKPQSTQQKKGKNQQRLSAPSPSPSPTIDPKLNNYHYDVDETFLPENAQHPSTKTQTTNSALGGDQVSPGPDIDVPKKYLVNIMQGTRRVKPEVTLEPGSCSGLSSLIQYVHTIVDDENLKVSKIKVWGPSGMIDVRSEDIWKDAIAIIMEVEWINGEVKCVVEVEKIRR